MLHTRFISRPSFLLSLSAVMTLSACSKIQNMEDKTNQMANTTSRMANTTDGMATTTAEMSGTTKDMSKTTNHMSKTTDGLSLMTCTMYRSLRQGNTKVSRDTDFKDIALADGVTAKLPLAAAYMQGFEYQVWTKACEDEMPRDMAIEQGIRELLTKMQEYAENRSNVAATNQSEDYSTLYAIAATLHYTNSLQAGFLKGSDEKVMRPLDILIEGIKYDQMKNRGELVDANFPAWATVVGKYEKDAEFLLRIRANFMMAYAYAVADSDDFGDAPGFLNKAWRIVTTKFFSKSWTPNLAKRSPTEIQERITTALDLAYETRMALVNLGIDPMVDQTILKVWRQADLSSYDLGKMEKASGDQPARAKAIRELAKARARILSKP